MSTCGTSCPSVNGAADLLADIKHRRVVALALADHDGAVHGNRIHRLAHGLGRNLIAQMTIALTHGARRFDGRVLNHAQEFQCEIAFRCSVRNSWRAVRDAARVSGWVWVAMIASGR